MAAEKRLTQTEIINQLSEKSGLKKSQLKDLLSELFQMAVSEVNKTGEFIIPGLGKFVKTERKAREGRNPATGQAIKISAKTTVKFRVGKEMKNAAGLSGGTNTSRPPKR